MALTEEIVRADARLQATIAALTEAQVGEPSLLPGWSRGHVLTHIARNADGLRNLLTWARTGVETPMYATPDTRATDIEAGAARPLVDHIADVREASDRFVAAAAEMPAEAWSVSLPKSGSATRIVWRRLREVEVHHVDLDAGYAPEHWPESFSHRLLHELTRDRPVDTAFELAAGDLSHPLQVGSGTPSVTVSGPSHELAAWLSGRADGSSLRVVPAGGLPTLPDWM
jgi:maleylpyruvate isomerase